MIQPRMPDSRTSSAKARPSRIRTPRDEPAPIDERRAAGARALPTEAPRGGPLPWRSCPTRCRHPTRTTAPATTTSSSSSATASPSARRTSRGASSRRRSSSASCETSELDDDETADLVALAAQGVIDEPASRLGRYLVAQLGARLARRRRVARLLAAQADLPRRVARPPGEARRARGRLGRGRRRVRLPAPGRRRAAAARARPGAVVARAAVPAVARRGRTSPRSLALDHYATYPEQLALGVAHVARARVAALARVSARAARAGARRRRVRDDRRGDGLADLGRLPLPAAQPAALRAARARARLPDRALARGRARAGTRARSSRPRPSSRPRWGSSG